MFQMYVLQSSVASFLSVPASGTHEPPEEFFFFLSIFLSSLFFLMLLLFLLRFNSGSLLPMVETDC